MFAIQTLERYLGKVALPGCLPRFLFDDAVFTVYGFAGIAHLTTKISREQWRVANLAHGKNESRKNCVRPGHCDWSNAWRGLTFYNACFHGVVHVQLAFFWRHVAQSSWWWSGEGNTRVDSILLEFSTKKRCLGCASSILWWCDVWCPSAFEFVNHCRKEYNYKSLQLCVQLRAWRRGIFFRTKRGCCSRFGTSILFQCLGSERVLRSIGQFKDELACRCCFAKIVFGFC